ncbi:MAG: DegT/DnrJ/EryC1/StrS aminotransferase family protein [Patescibacteria group bacterium]
MKVPFFRHNIERADIGRVEKVLRGPVLTTGAYVRTFEEKLTAFLGVRGGHVRGTTSCTSALFLSLEAHGIGRGDEVITTPLSYVATAHVIEQVGAKPVFVDVDSRTGNINVDHIAEAITKKTKAILPVHLYGQMVDMKKMSRIARAHKLFVIEDAAHALEAERDGIRPGMVSDAACFSFYATKSITSGEGGAVVTRHKSIADHIAKTRLHGVSRSMADRYGKLYQHYDVPVLGWKFNMTNIQAALLIGQLARARKVWKRRAVIAERYERAFQKAGIEFLQTDPGVTHARHLSTALVDAPRRDEILHALESHGIGVAVNYRPIHLMTYYRKKYGYREGDFPHAESIGARTITLPLYSKLTDKEVSKVIEVVEKILS